MEERKLDDAMIASATGIGRSTITNYASGRTNMSIGKVEAVARFLKLDPAVVAKQEGAVFNDSGVSALRESSGEYGSPANPLAAFGEDELLAKAVFTLQDAKMALYDKAARTIPLLREILQRTEP